MVQPTHTVRLVNRLPLDLYNPAPESIRRERKAAPLFPRRTQLKFCREILAAPSLAASAGIIEAWAQRFPAATPKPDRRGKLVTRPGWRETLLSLAAGLRDGSPAFAVVSLEGNDKLGRFATWSTLPLFTCPGMGECGRWCYSLRSWRCPGALARQVQNTLLLKFRPDLVRASFLALPAGITFRLYVDGDFGSLGDVRFWVGLLWLRPDVQAYGYSKSWEQLWAYHTDNGGHWPGNYLLNVSSGGRPQTVTAEQIRSLPICRGDFKALKIDYRPMGPDGKPKRGNVGNDRYKDPAYHAAVRKAAKRAGIKRPFSCPGKCDECSEYGHVCGTERFRGVTVVIGIH